MQSLKRYGSQVALGIVVALPTSAWAAIDTSGMLDKTLMRYQTAITTWSGYLTQCATFLFVSLALISAVYTFFKWDNDIGNLLAEMTRFVVFVGFNWWLLTNATVISSSIYDSMRLMAGRTSGSGVTSLSPSGVMDIGFEIFQSIVKYSSVTAPIDTAVSMTLAICVALCLATVAVNMTVLLICSWFMGYAGIFFLGFGGSKWTSDIAMNYYRTVLSVGAELFGMILVVGVGKSILDEFRKGMDANPTFLDLGAMFIVAYFLMQISSRLPSMLGGLVSGANLRGGADMGAGASAMGMATMAAAAASMGHRGLMDAGASAWGGASAVRAALSLAGSAAASGSNLAADSSGDSIGSASSQSGSTPGQSHLNSHDLRKV